MKIKYELIECTNWSFMRSFNKWGHSYLTFHNQADNTTFHSDENTSSTNAHHTHNIVDTTRDMRYRRHVTNIYHILVDNKNHIWNLFRCPHRCCYNVFCVVAATPYWARTIQLANYYCSGGRFHYYNEYFLCCCYCCLCLNEKQIIIVQ